MNDSDACLFVTIATLETPTRWSRPFLIRAPTMAEASIMLIDQNHSMFQHPHARFEGHVIGAGRIAARAQCGSRSEARPRCVGDGATVSISCSRTFTLQRCSKKKKVGAQ